MLLVIYRMLLTYYLNRSSMKLFLLCLVMLLSYHFSDINSQFMVMSGNIRMERVL